MLKKHLTNRKFYLFVLLIVLVFMPMYSASAECSWWQSALGTAVPFAGGLPCAVNAATGSTWDQGLMWVLQFITQALAWALAWIMSAFNFLVYIRIDKGMPVLKATWTILRDISNMFFILVLIWMAFATIFNVGRHRFPDMIWRFLIVAVLINFSLVIGGLVIDAAQILVNVFLNMIGNPGDRLGAFLKPYQLLPGIVNEGTLVGAIFGIVLGLMLLFSMLIAVIFATIRIFALWGLLIVAPIAWMAYILPGTQKWFSKWWGTFIGWNLFLPCFLFILYIGLLFLSKSDEVIATITGNQNTGNFLNTSVSFNMFFFYAFAAGFLTYGTVMAAKLTTAFGAGDGFQKGLGWATTAIKRMPGFSSYFAAQKAADARIKPFQEEGFKNKYLGKFAYGGEAGRKRQEAWWAERFGVRSAEFKNQKDFVSDVNKEAARLKDQEKAGQLEVTADLADGYNITSKEGAARKSILYERGMVTGEQFNKDMSILVRKNPFLAQDLSKKAKGAKYKNVNPIQILQMAAAEGEYARFAVPQAVGLRKEWFDFVVGEDRSIDIMTAKQYGIAIKLMGDKETKEGSDFRKKLMKKRPDIVMEYETADMTAEKRLEAWRKEFAKPDLTPSDVGKLPLAAWNNPTSDGVKS